MMSPDDAKAFILQRIEIDRADIADAKSYLSGLTEKFSVEEVATRRAGDIAGPLEKQLPLWHDDPTPVLERFAQNWNVRLCMANSKIGQHLLRGLRSC